MKTRTTIAMLSLLVVAAPLMAQERSQLPSEAAALVNQLDDWEEKRRVEFESEIRAKRSQVAQLLKKHQDKATKSGDLDGAIAIREIIKTLNGTSPEQKRTKTPASTTQADPVQAGSKWVSGDSKMLLTITKRDRTAFNATLTVGKATVREIKGTITGNQLSWSAKDVRAKSGGRGGDNVGIVRGDKIDFSWTNDEGQGGNYSLQLLQQNPNWMFGKWTESTTANRKNKPLEILKDGTATHGSSGTWRDKGQEVVINWENGVVTRIQKLKSDSQKLHTTVVRRDGETSNIDYVKLSGG